MGDTARAPRVEGGVMVEIGTQLIVTNREDWRTWLEEHHAIEKEIWLVFYKKHTRQSGISYDDAVEEALCFGWIDGIMKRIDDEKHVLRFSPRKSNSIWSETNKRRVAKLIRAGRMTKAGLTKIKEAKKNGEWEKATRREDTTKIPAELEQALRASKKANHNFTRLAPSHKKQFLGWIAQARRDATRQKRIQQIIHMLEEHRKLGGQ